MKLDLSEILAHAGLRLPYEVDEPPIVDEDLECAEGIRGNLAFTNTGNVLLMNGAAATRVVLACSRCLSYYEMPVSIKVDEQFTLEVRSSGPRGRTAQVVIEEDENPDAAALFDGPLFDLTELLRQEIMLALPSQPLHDEACKGLCASCGGNLNEGACGCAPQASHPALAELGKLLQTDDKES